MNYNIVKLKDINPQLTEKLRQYTYDIIGCCQLVHRDLGPFLNEYMYQDALVISFEEFGISPFEKEHYFSVDFHGKRISHRHFVDFFVREKVYIECKAIDHIGKEQRIQLWNYMRLSKVSIGILYNFAPIKDECERYYLDTDSNAMFVF